MSKGRNKERGGGGGGNQTFYSIPQGSFTGREKYTHRNGAQICFWFRLVYKRCLLVFRSSHINVRGKRPSLPPLCENLAKLVVNYVILSDTVKSEEIHRPKTTSIHLLATDPQHLKETYHTIKPSCSTALTYVFRLKTFFLSISC